MPYEMILTERTSLMELRKTCAHPYLVSSDIEPQGVTSARAHANLVDASEKFRVLQMMLPKLKQRGHRVLLFSQFIIVLDVIERFASPLLYA